MEQNNLEILYITDSVYWIWILRTPSPVKTHYSKSQIIVQKFHFDFVIFLGKKSCQQLKIPNIFTSFSPEFFFFLTIFSWKQSCQQAKKSKTAAFSRVFTQNSKTIFLGKSKLNFRTKNKDFEQCAKWIKDTIQNNEMLYLLFCDYIL